MRILRISPLCLVIWILLSTILYLACTLFSWVTRIRISSTSMSSDFMHTCNMTDEYRFRLGQMLEKVHEILSQNQLEHFLCYGTLWGQIRIGSVFPWASKAYLGVFQNQFADINEGILYSSFQQEFLQLTYSPAEAVYTVQRNHHEHPQVELIVFGSDDEQHVFKRVGWRRGLLPPDCDWSPALDCFPKHLIQHPLPVKKLGQHSYPVPMGGIELQKYHYADNWWKTVTTRNCN